MDAFLQDLRYALRSVRTRPLFAVVGALSLAVGVGVNTLLFSAVNGLLLRPLPAIAEPDRVVEVGRGRDGRGFDTFSYPDFLDLRAQVGALEAAAAYRTGVMSLSSEGGEGERVVTMHVSPSYFRVLGLTPRWGRFFTPSEEEGPGENPVVVVSHGFWERAMGADPEALGRTLRLNRRSYTVVGVTAPDFVGHMAVVSPDVFVPISEYAPVRLDGYLDRRTASWHQVLALRSPGASLETVNAQLEALASRLSEAHPGTHASRTFRAVPLGPVPGGARGPVAGFLGALLGLAAIVLVVTCANLGGMFLARALDREREVATRLALGAARSRLVRQLLVETLVVFALGGLVGGILAWIGVGLLPLDRLPVPIPIHLDLSPDLTVLAFAVGVTLVSGLLFGLAPAVRATRVDLVRSLKEGSSRAGVRGRRLRRLFVGGQVGLSVVLLVAAGLFIRSLDRAGGVETGFDPTDVWMTTVDLDLEGYRDTARARTAQTGMVERVAALPGVESAALASDLPLDLGTRGSVIWRADDAAGDGEPLGVQFNEVSPGYFRTLRLPILRGRGFTAEDGLGAEPVIIVGRTLVRRLWPQGGALGRRIRFGRSDAPLRTIVGVVEDVKNSTISEAPQPQVYLPLAQWYEASTHVLARVDGSTPGVPPLREAVLEVDPSLSTTPVISVARYTSVGVLPQRVAAGLVSGLGVLALLLSALGVYGVLATSVARSRHEIGVRMALGASRLRVVGHLVGRLAVLVVPGLVLGGVLGALVGRLLASRGFLLGLPATDLPAVAGAVVALLAGVAAAAVVPGARAAGVEPAAALRYE